MAIMVGAALCTAVGLTACGNGSEQPASSNESSAEASSAEAVDAQNATASMLSEIYMPTKAVVNASDGSTKTSILDFDDQGRQLENLYEIVSDSPYKADYVPSEWDKYGHATKAETTYDYGDGKPFTVTEEMTYDLNKDGIVTKQTESYTYNKDSFEEGEDASETRTTTYEYGSDAQVVRRSEMKAESFDQSGVLLYSATIVHEYDEDGLETSYTVDTTDSEGNTHNTTATITWTKDADGKPTACEMVLNNDGEDPQTLTADVEVGESGMISKVSNVVVDGEAHSTTVTIEQTRIENPLPNAVEGCKSFALTDVMLS